MGFYDNEIKRLCKNCPRLLIMVINSIFQKSYSLQESIVYLDKEQNEEGQPTYLDLLLEVAQTRYHLEFQLVAGNMAIRMYEYAVRDTLQELAGECGEKRYEITVVMPMQAVVFLAGAGQERVIRVNLILPDETRATYTIPCVSASDTVEELCERQLYLFLPFQQVQLHSRLDAIHNCTEETKHRMSLTLYDFHQTVKNKLAGLCEDDRIEVKEYENLLVAFSNIETYLLEKDAFILEEVEEMGKDDYVAWSDRILEQGIEQGIERGIEQGIEQGTERGQIVKMISQVCKKLRKGNTPAEAADALEEDEQEIIRIYKVAEHFAPDYDVEAIYRELEKEQMVSAVSLE